MNKLFRLAALLVALTLAVSACGGPAPATPAPAATEAPAAATQAPAPTDAPAPTQAPPAATDAPKILRIRATADLANLDPAIQPSSQDEMMAVPIIEGLVSYEPGGLDVVNWLAEEMTPSEDGLTIDFKIREGVQFHGGYGEMTAEDVKFSFERFIDPELDSPYRGDWVALDRVEVTGPYTGRIILKEPFAALWTTTLPVSSGWVISKKAAEEMGAAAFGTHPIGTGPYEFVEWRPNEILILRRFADYWGEPLEWDEIHFLPIVADSAAEIALETGDVDFTQIAHASVERIQADSRFMVQDYNTLGYIWLAMNVQHPNLADINVRRAIRAAVDVPAILEAAYDNKVQRACALIAPGQVGHWADAPCYERDLDLAREYLAQAAALPVGLTITSDDSEDSRTAAEVIQANLAEIGLDAEIIVQDASAFWDGGFGEQGITNRQLTWISYSTNPDPSWSTVWFTCEQVDEWNWMYWCNEEYDRLHAEALVDFDQDVRTEKYIRMQQIWDEAAHTVWVAYTTLYYAWRADLEVSVSPFGRVLAPWFHSK